MDPVLDHGVAAHPERVALTRADHRFRHLDRLGILDRLDGPSRRDKPKERKSRRRAIAKPGTIACRGLPRRP